ncbi:MAG: sulfotransferase [Candidatus Limnocylindria bacterium]
MIDQPVFVAGLDRTGKTPMRIALEAHADVAFSRRTELWTRHFGRYGDLGLDRRARRAVTGLIGDRHVAQLVVDPSRLMRDFLAGPRSYGYLFALVGRQHAERLGRSRWGDQTALVERHADAILECFPNARFIHMVRDPRDRYAATNDSAGVGPGGLGAACAAWNESSALARANATAHGSSYLVVRYEDLAQDPVPTISRALEHIGATSTPGNAPPASPALAAGVGAYRDAVPPRSIALIEAAARDGMRAFHYEPTMTDLEPIDRLRLTLIDRPWARATGAASRLARVWRAAQRRTGAGLAGRS